MKIFSIIFLIFLSLILVYLTLYLIAVRVMYRKIFGRKKISKRLDEKSNLINLYQIDLCWWGKYKFDELTIVSEDGLKLKGHYLENQTNKTVILVHGYGSDYREMQGYAKIFYNMGYNLLVVENRTHGSSEGNAIGMGWFDKEDILSWVNVLVEKNPQCKILLFGTSMGGTAVCMVTSLKLPQNVVCAISDSAFINVYEQIKLVMLKKKFPLKKFLLKIFYNYMKRVFNIDLKGLDCLECLKKSKIPMMFIHGKNDNLVPYTDSFKMVNSLPEYRRDFYFVDEADHLMSIVKNPGKYEYKVREFLKKWGM